MGKRFIRTNDIDLLCRTSVHLSKEGKIKKSFKNQSDLRNGKVILYFIKTDVHVFRTNLKISNKI